VKKYHITNPEYYASENVMTQLTSFFNPSEKDWYGEYYK